MKKSLIALLAIGFVAVPVLGGVATAETQNVTKSIKNYKLKALKPTNDNFALEQADNNKVKIPFKYNGPRDAFFINGIN